VKGFLLTDHKAKIRYHDLLGDGPPILFLHGLGCSSSFDYPQVAAFRELKQHRRILVDLLGSGYSDNPEDFSYSMAAHASCLEQLIEHMGLDNFYLYGHSMGGAIAISLAGKCEQRLSGLVLSEANLDSGGGLFSRRIAGHEEGGYLESGHQTMIRNARASACDEWAVGLAASAPVAVYRESKSLVDGEAPSWRQILYSLNIPRTFIFGQKSLPDPEESRLKANGINIEIVDNAGHSMAWDNPAGLAAAIQRGIHFAG